MSNEISISEYIVKDLFSLLQTNSFRPTGGTVVTEIKQETEVKNRASCKSLDISIYFVTDQYLYWNVGYE